MKICLKSLRGLYNKYFASFTLLSTMHEKTRSVMQSHKISELLTAKREQTRQTVQVMAQVSSDRLVNEYIMTETKRFQSIRTFPYVKWHLTRVPTCHNPDRQLLPRVNSASASSRSRQVSTSSRREVFELPYQCCSTMLNVQIS